jgi:signal transduction histidine kinase
MAATDLPTPDPLSARDVEIARLSAALALAERDRQLLGYEIHDGLIQDLTAAAMLLEAAGREARFGSPEVADNFTGGLRLLRESIVEGRRIIRGLAAAELDERGLPSALARLVEKFRSELALPVTLAAETGNLVLPASAQRLLLRIAQEALFNVWKHAAATVVEVTLDYHQRVLELTIADNGTGFNTGQIPAGHFGVEGMRARAEILGARLEIASVPGQGTRVTVRWTVGSPAPPA